MLRNATPIRYTGAVLCLALVGCASIKNTPQQDYVWSCVDACKADIPPQCQINTVDTDGRYSGGCVGTLANLDNFNRCMQRQYQERPYSVWLKERAK